MSQAEKDFTWAMERLRHALDMFQTGSSAGLRFKRDLDYELFPPDEEQKHYTALVTLTTKIVYVSGPAAPSGRREPPPPRPRQPTPEDLNSQDPFALPGDNPVTQITPQDLDSLRPQRPKLVDPVIPPQHTKERVECRMEYRSGTWRVTNPEEIASVQEWFDYALQQGEYAPH